MKNPIVHREFIGTLRSRKAFALQVGTAVAFSLLVLIRWPTGALIDLSGAPSQRVFRIFGYGLMTMLVLLSPVFPATSIVREKNRGTLMLLLTSPMSPWAIYFGKLFGAMGFVLLLLVMSLPAAAACYTMGGISLTSGLLTLYGVLVVLILQYVALGLCISSYASAADAALRWTYGAVLLMVVVSLGPHQFFQGQPGLVPVLADWLRHLSPIVAIMEILGDADVGSQGIKLGADATIKFLIIAICTSAVFILLTVSRLNHKIFDRARSQGTMSDEQSLGVQILRRLFFLVDPQRRKSGVPPLVNPIMVKEFRCRRFGRLHWILRLVAFCAIISLFLAYAATTGTIDWDVEMIGGIMVILQAALIVLLTPSLAANLICAEREGGGWQLLQMTPLSGGKVVSGKLLSVIGPLTLLLFATLPGYAVMYFIRREMWLQIVTVEYCLLFSTVFALTLSAAISSLFQRTAIATSVAYMLLVFVFAGTILIWMGRDAPFAHQTVENALRINPMAAALNVMKVPGFTQYDLIPVSWQISGTVSAGFFAVLCFQTWRLTRPQ
ncbi:MAG: ABC transporter permease subunit [Pirellulaceae bacterium]|nr:ABC transporter permease subunit [Pirellulaceae bacterium]